MADSTPWVIWSYEHDSWNSCGYRISLMAAGVYTEAEAKKIATDANQHPNPRLVTNTNPEGKSEVPMSLATAIIFAADGHPREGTVGWHLARPFEPRDHLRVLGAAQAVKDLSGGKANNDALAALRRIAWIVEGMEKPEDG